MATYKTLLTLAKSIYQCPLTYFFSFLVMIKKNFSKKQHFQENVFELNFYLENKKGEREGKRKNLYSTH